MSKSRNDEHDEFMARVEMILNEDSELLERLA